MVTGKVVAGGTNTHNRIATRYVFESRMQIRFCRNGRTLTAAAWSRDLSESGIGAFAAQDLVIGELVNLHIELGDFGKETIPAKVSRKVGTQYGFQFTSLSSLQRLAIQAAVQGQAAIPY